MASWDAVKVQSQLRLTAYRLAQLQERHDRTSNITRNDISTLISQNKISAARSKVEKLIQDERSSALIERLEAYCNLLLERVSELGRPIDFESSSPLLEAICGILLVAQQANLIDIFPLRDMLEQIYGLEFGRLAMKNHANHVPSQMIDVLHGHPPRAVQVDVYMVSIAKEYNLSWTPPLLPHQKVHALSEVLDQNAFPRIVDFEKLRQICSRGIPAQPPWLRPRVWKLLLGTSSHQKDHWEIEAHRRRQSYYDLTRPLLDRINGASPPTTPLSHMDMSLLNMAKSLSALPEELDGGLESSPLCPFDDDAPDGLKVKTASAVDQRLKLIKTHIHGPDSINGTPEIRLELANTPPSSTTQFSMSSPTGPVDQSVHKAPATSLHSSASTRSHASSLLRLAYIYMALHPSTPTMYLISILVPLYAVMVQEIERAELAHVEADTFWVLAEVWGEVGELSEDEESRVWMQRLGRRLAWADPELSNDLVRKGLDPALPNYSYRWLALLLTRTLPRPSVLIVWDALFSQLPRTSETNAKLEFLVDICISMLITSRAKLLRLGRQAAKLPGLWGDVDVSVTEPYHTTAEFEEEFIQGMALLQDYPIDELGGVERVVEIAVDLANRRRQLGLRSATVPGLGERLTGMVWSGLIAKAAPSGSPIAEPNNESEGTPSPEWPDSGAEDEPRATKAPGSEFLGRIGSSVWRGITNQSSMDVPSSPLSPPSPIRPSSPATEPVGSSSSSPVAGEAVRIGSKLSNSIWRGLTNQSAMEVPRSPAMQPSPRPVNEGLRSPISPSVFWSYTEKLRDSDAAASLSKTSTNWTAKASTLWRRSNPSSTVSSPGTSTQHTRTESLGMAGKNWTDMLSKRGSLPNHHQDRYSPPPRPNFRESRYFSQEERPIPGSPSRSIIGLPSPPTLLAKSKSTLASLTGTTIASTPKSGPRPLLLSSSSLITPSNPRRLSRSPTPRDSISSVSSSSTTLSVVQNNTYSDRDSEPSTSRFIPLRSTASPRPIRFSSRSKIQEGTRHSQPGIESEPMREQFIPTRSQNLERRPSSEDGARRGWGPVELPDSPSTLPSSPPPKTPTSGPNLRDDGGSGQRGSIRALNDAVHPVSIDKRLGRKKSWSMTSPASPLEPASDSSTSQGNAPILRSKRYVQRPANLRLKKSDHELGRSPSATLGEREGIGLPDSISDTTINTPRANDFPSPSSPGRPTRVRRTSKSPRPLLRTDDLPTKGSGGEEGDDEGYDEFISAYSSEDSHGPQMTAASP